PRLARMAAPRCGAFGELPRRGTIRCCPSARGKEQEAEDRLWALDARGSVGRNIPRRSIKRLVSWPFRAELIAKLLFIVRNAEKKMRGKPYGGHGCRRRYRQSVDTRRRGSGG